jgi:tetratricopeptide (TPR) repeat protein
VTPPAGAAEEWAARDVRSIELKAVSTNLGAKAADLEALLPTLLALDFARAQLQPLLEKAWTRLQALREQIAGLRARISDPEVVQWIERADGALSAAGAPSVTTAVESLGRAFDACRERQGSDDSAACLRAAQAVAAAVSAEFRRAATLSAEAAELGHADPDTCWQYRAQQAEFLLDQGREFNDVGSLRAVERLCEETLLPMAPAGPRSDERAWTYDCLGHALGILGRQQRSTRTLERAVKAFEDSLELRDRERSPFDWAATQNNLGNAIGILGQRQHDRELLERSVAAFESALEVPISNSAPEARASAYSNLAAVLQTLGEQKKDAEMLERAVDGYKAALAIWTSERKPLTWAATMSNLGSALRLLGGLQERPHTLEQSVTAYNAALSVRTRGRMPYEWGMTQNDLGAALQALGERTDDLLTLGRAIAAYREALKEIDHDRGPMAWAMTMANLGVARRKLAERNHDVDIARRAAADIKMAVEVFRGASHARLTELGVEQLSIAHRLSAALESSAAP